MPRRVSQSLVRRLGHTAIPPVGVHEIAGLAPLMFLIVVIGVYPRPVLEQMRPALALLDRTTQAAHRHRNQNERRWGEGGAEGLAEALPGLRKFAVPDVPRRRGRDQREAAMSSAFSLFVVQKTALVLLPELILLASAIVMMTGSVFIERPRRFWCGLRRRCVACHFLALLSVGRDAHRSFMPRWRSTTICSFYARLVLLFSAGILLGLAHQEPSDEWAGEFFGCLLIISTAPCWWRRRTRWCSVVGLELVSIPTYVILYLSQHDRTTQEAATKFSS